MMNQYPHPQTYTTSPSQHHFHGSNPTTTTTSTVFQSPSTNYNFYRSFPSPKHQPSFYDSSIIENSYEPYSIDNSTRIESIYHPIQSFDQCQNYSNNSELTNQSYPNFLLSNNQPTILEQSSIDQKPIINEAKYKWMQIKRTPAKTSSIVLK
jgi:hypothetical protein